MHVSLSNTYSYLAANVSESCTMFGQVQNRPISLAKKNYKSKNVLVTHGIPVCFSKMIQWIQWIQWQKNQDWKRFDLETVFVASEHLNQQECIPVGCVPPALCPYLPACTAPVGVSASGGSQHAMEQTPPPRGQNSWHTLLKILPCPNFVAGGNN